MHMYMYMRLYHGRSLRTCQPWTELLAQQACWERSPDCTRRRKALAGYNEALVSRATSVSMFAGMLLEDDAAVPSR